LATFDNDGIQANITTSDLTFVNQSAQVIRNYISAQNPGIFEGVPYQLFADGVQIFDGFIDLADGFEEITPVKVRAKIKQLDLLPNIDERAAAITFEMLRQEGFITNNDFVTVQYVVEKKFNFLEFAMLSLTTYLMLRELIDLTRNISKNIAVISSLATLSVPSPQSVALASALLIAADIAFAGIIIIYLINLMNELISYVFPPTRQYKGIRINKAMERAAAYLGYTWQPSTYITGANDFVYLPSKDIPGGLLSSSQPEFGIPRPGDYGYTMAEMMTLWRDLFRSKLFIQSGAIRCEPLMNDGFWVQPATYTIPSVLNEVKRYNTDELSARRLLRFDTDVNDQWTLDEFRGTMYEIATTPITVNDQRMVSMKGLGEVAWPLALGSRKDGLNALEQALANLALLVDTVVGAFGGNSNLSAPIFGRVGLLRISSNQVQIPKLLYMTGTPLRIPSNHRYILSAKALWERYHVEDSFVQNNWRGQKMPFVVTVPFGVQAFNNLVDNSYCTTENGETAKVTECRWNYAGNRATLSGWVRKPYTKNLKEIYHEPGDNQ
jgi:hypothetical protein